MISWRQEIKKNLEKIAYPFPICCTLYLSSPSWVRTFCIALLSANMALFLYSHDIVLYTLALLLFQTYPLIFLIAFPTIQCCQYNWSQSPISVVIHLGEGLVRSLEIHILITHLKRQKNHIIRSCRSKFGIHPIITHIVLSKTSSVIY